MTTLQKIIHARVTKGQISISGKKKKGGEKGTWHLQGEQYKRLQHPDLRARGGGPSATGNQGNNVTISQQLSLPFPITDKPA